MKWLLFTTLTLFDLITAIFIISSALNKHIFTISIWYKIGLLFAALGFLAQSTLNLPYILFNHEVSSQTLPFWILKDLGIGLICIHFFWCLIINKQLNIVTKK